MMKEVFFAVAVFCFLFFQWFPMLPFDHFDRGPEVSDYVREVWQIDDGLPQNYIRVILQTRDGYIWAATQEGIARFDGVKFVTFNNENTPEIRINYVHALIEDREGSLWIGTDGGGLLRFKAGKFTGFRSKIGAPDDIVMSLCEDREGSIWIGTHGGGLIRFKNGTFTTLNPKGILTDYDVLSIYEDSKGTLWIGTNQGGLIRFKQGKFTTFNRKKGLSNSTVLSIYEDRKGNLWIGTAGGGGLYQLKHSKFKTCTTREGLPKGVVIIDPNNIKTNPIIPTVIIEKIKIDDIVIDAVQDIEISPGKRRFEFHYTAPSFVAPKKMEFRYKLEGFEKEWINAGSSTGRTACYTNIPPGSYCFRVIAGNNDGTWNKTGASFNFSLKPFFYQTYWFYGTCILCVLAMGIGIHWLRVRQIIIRERKKYEKARLTSETAEKYLKRLLHYMESKKPYLDPDISLHKLSEDINIPHHYLSQVINARLDRNFYDFINFYRIGEARKILSDSKNHLPILGVAFEVGFNSKSAFNRAFKKNVNMTPSDFKKERNGFK